MRSAAAITPACSQTRTTHQSAAAKAASVSLSRCTFLSSLRRHHSALFLGSVPCSGQRCQKQPSTNTAIRRRGKTMSARRRRPGSGAVSTLYLRPRRWSSRRSASSGSVSRLGIRWNRSRTFCDAGTGAGLTPPAGTSPVSAPRSRDHNPYPSGRATGAPQICSITCRASSGD